MRRKRRQEGPWAVGTGAWKGGGAVARGGELCPCSWPVSDTRVPIMTGSPVSQEWQVGLGGSAGAPDPQGEEVRAQRGIYCKAGKMAAQSPGIGTASQQSPGTWGGLGGGAQAHPQGAQSALVARQVLPPLGGCRGRSPSAACALWAWGRQPGSPKASSTAPGPPSNQTERKMPNQMQPRGRHPNQNRDPGLQRGSRCPLMALQ